MNAEATMTETRTTILHIISSAGIGGGERYLLDLLQWSSARFNHAVIIPHAGWLHQALKEGGHHHHLIAMPRFPSPLSLMKMIQHARRVNADIIHSHGFRANLYARIVAWLSCRRHMTTMHVSLYDYKDIPALLRRLYMMAERRLSFITEAVICISKAMQEDALKMGVPANKLHLIHNGIDPARFQVKSNTKQLRHKLGLSENNPVIGTVGRLVTEKGQIHLIRALPRIVDRFPDLKCLFVGEGPLLAELRQTADQYGVTAACLFTGPYPDIQEIYTLLDLFVLPSLREPFGLVVLEAMAAGLPAIATRSGGPMEFIEPGETGLLVPPRDPEAMAEAVIRLLSEPELRHTLATNGRQMVTNRFHIKSTVAAIESLYSPGAERPDR